MSTRKLSAEDQLDILALFARYAWAYDSGDTAAYAATFAPDDALADEDGVLGRGRAGIADALQKIYRFARLG
jgi:ketosteroid isomerase-like protein